MEDADSRSKDEFRRRATVLRTLAGRPPGGVRGRRALEEAIDVFGGESDLLLAAHQRWQVHLLARLDLALERGGDDPHGDVVRVVEELARTMPGIAALLADHTVDPVLDPARRRLAGYVAQACPCGRPHPLVASAATVRQPARCALLNALAASERRGLNRLVRLAAEHCRRRPPAATWQFG